MKMPANLSHPRPTSIPDLRWFTGTITATFLPGAHTETPLAEEGMVELLATLLKHKSSLLIATSYFVSGAAGITSAKYPSDPPTCHAEVSFLSAFAS